MRRDHENSTGAREGAASDAPFRIAYLVNQYPKISHSFIRREILELERQGFLVQRIAMRGWDAELADAQDVIERERTHYVLRNGAPGQLLALLRMAVTRPLRLARAFGLALRVGRRADRPLPIHLFYLAEACHIVPLLARTGARHLHAHFGTNSAEVAMLVGVLCDTPYSLTVHGSEEFDKPEFLHLREKLARAAFVVAVSSFCRSQLFRCMAHEQWGKVHVVHCALEPAFYKVAAVAIPATPRLVCVGRLCEQKGQLLLLDAIHRLARRGVRLDLVLAGDGEMRPELEALIGQHRLEQRVRITGWISGEQVRDEILAARALVLTSFAEGLPVVIMEAMALRRPVLTTAIAGIPELVQNGQTGWLFPAGDVDALTEALEAFLNTPPSELERMGNMAQRRVLEQHSVETEVARLAALFRSCHMVPALEDAVC